MGNNKFDPNKASIGVWNREGFNPGHKPAHQAGGGIDVPISDAGGVEDYESERASIARIGKSAAYADTYESFVKEADEQGATPNGEYSPSDIEYPLFPEPGGENLGGATRTSSGDTDLDTHGSHEAPKPSADKLIKERLRNMRMQIMHNAKEEVQAQEEKQNKEYESFQGTPTDIGVKRRETDSSRSGGGLVKASSAKLSLLASDDANPIKIMLLLDGEWGDDWHDWEPETITQTIEADGIEVAKVNLDKIMALKVLIKTDEFWKSPRVFEKVCLAFAGRMVDWGHIQEPRVHDLAACVAVIERYISEKEWSDNVQTYVAGVAVRDGYVMLPPVLSFAQIPFYNELVFAMGDEVLSVQDQLMSAMKEEDEIPQDHVVQYMRLLRCQYHTQEFIDQAKA